MRWSPPTAALIAIPLLISCGSITTGIAQDEPEGPSIVDREDLGLQEAALAADRLATSLKQLSESLDALGQTIGSLDSTASDSELIKANDAAINQLGTDLAISSSSDTEALVDAIGRLESAVRESLLPLQSTVQDLGFMTYLNAFHNCRYAADGPRAGELGCRRSVLDRMDEYLRYTQLLAEKAAE